MYVLGEGGREVASTVLAALVLASPSAAKCEMFSRFY